MAESKDNYNYKPFYFVGLILALAILCILGFGKDKASREQKVQNDTISLVVDTAHVNSPEVTDSVVDAIVVDAAASLEDE